ncbi:MAG: hypothetical protein LBM65_07130 [Oscillospiraceae bacterium]|jgi:hypothetical protein|nr:hypothetical protein [Oscillospiraceae bacterium]
MKKIFILALAIVCLAAMLCGCGGNNATNTADTTAAPAAALTTVADTTAAPSVTSAQQGTAVLHAYLDELVTEYGRSSKRTTIAEDSERNRTITSTDQYGLLASKLIDVNNDNTQEFITAVISGDAQKDVLEIALFSPNGIIGKSLELKANFSNGEQPPTVFLKTHNNTTYLCVIAEGGSMFFGGSAYSQQLSVYKFDADFNFVLQKTFGSSRGAGANSTVNITDSGNGETIYSSGTIQSTDRDAKLAAFNKVKTSLAEYGLQDQVEFGDDDMSSPCNFDFEDESVGVVPICGGELDYARGTGSLSYVVEYEDYTSGDDD